MYLHQVFFEMRHLPKGVWIENPYDLVQTDFIISDSILPILNTSNTSVFFTRLSLKHLAEKGDAGEYILLKIKNILAEPDGVYIGNFENRFLISKMMIFQNDTKAHVITLEITKDLGNIIVTGFVSKLAYFKNLKLLWGTASSPSQQS